jgi:hypothetical protein
MAWVCRSRVRSVIGRSCSDIQIAAQPTHSLGIYSPGLPFAQPPIRQPTRRPPARPPIPRAHSPAHVTRSPARPTDARLLTAGTGHSKLETLRSIINNQPSAINTRRVAFDASHLTLHTRRSMGDTRHRPHTPHPTPHTPYPPPHITLSSARALRARFTPSNMREE